MKRLILLVALVMAMAVLAPAAFADEPAEVEGADVETEEKDPFEAQLWKAQMIAGYLAGDDPTEDDAKAALAEVEGWRAGDPAMGWGVLSKLTAWAVAMDMDIVEVLALAPGDDGGYALGQIRKLYLADREAEDGVYGELPYKNFGQLQKEQRPDKTVKATPPGQNKKDKNDG